MKNFAFHHPFLFGTLVTLSAVLGQIWPLWLPGLSQGFQILLARATDVAIAIFLLSQLHWWREAGFTRIRSWRILLPYLPLILLVLLSMVSVIGTAGIKVNDPVLILLGAMSFLAGGFVEEALFRGIVLRAFLPRRLMQAALLSSVIFSLAHLPNLLLGQALGATALQLLRTFVVGFAFIAPLAYTRNIWPLVILHALINFSGFLSSGNITAISTENPETSQVLAEIAIFGMFAAYGFWLLRGAERRTDEGGNSTKQLPLVGQVRR